MMRRLKLCLFVMIVAAAALRADTTRPAGDWDSVTVPPMKTSIYVGSVTLTTSVFRREGEIYRATYEAKVWPWFFWSEKGSIAINLPGADLTRLLRGERVEFTGAAENQKKKPRHVTGRVERVDAANGKIKVRVGADDVTLVFNGPYRFTNVVK